MALLRNHGLMDYSVILMMAPVVPGGAGSNGTRTEGSGGAASGGGSSGGGSSGGGSGGITRAASGGSATSDETLMLGTGSAVGVAAAAGAGVPSTRATNGSGGGGGGGGGSGGIERTASDTEDTVLSGGAAAAAAAAATALPSASLAASGAACILTLSMNKAAELETADAMALLDAAAGFPTRLRAASAATTLGPWSAAATHLVRAAVPASAAAAAASAPLRGDGRYEYYLMQVGVIDVLQAFNGDKRLERNFKQSVYSLSTCRWDAPLNISAIDAPEYATRFGGMVRAAFRDADQAPLDDGELETGGVWFGGDRYAAAARRRALRIA